MQANPAQPPRGAPRRTLPDEVGAQFRGRYPRWALLAAIIWVPILAGAYLIQQHDPALYCRNRYVCAVYQWPSAVHIGLEILLYLLLWQLAQAFGMRPLEMATRFSPLGDWVRDLSEWRSARLPIYVLATTGLLSLIAAFFVGVSVEPIIVVMLGIIIFVAIIMRMYREPRPWRVAAGEGNQAGAGNGQPADDAAEAEARRIQRTVSPGYLFFTTWPWRLLTLIPFIGRWVFGPEGAAPAAAADAPAPPPGNAPLDPGGRPRRFEPPI